MEALATARARVAEAIAARRAAFRELQRKLEERQKHKESVIQEIHARSGMSLKVSDERSFCLQFGSASRSVRKFG